jgi:hypothetical protein
LGAVLTISSPEQVALPIYAYLPSFAEEAALMQMGQSLVNECVDASGGVLHSYWSMMPFGGGQVRPATASDLSSYLQFDRRMDSVRSGMWGFFDPVNVAQYGYAMPPDQVALTLSPDDSTLESCFSRVDSVTPGGHAAWLFQLSDLPDGGPGWHPEDSRFVAAEQQWSSCMKAKGFTYATPVAAVGENSAPGSDPSTALATASADVDCKVSTNLVGVAVAVQSAYEQQWIDAHRDALAQLGQQISSYLSGAVTVPLSVPSTSQPSDSHS